MPTSIAPRLRQAAPLAEIFAARSVAVIGASSDPNKAGYQVLKKLLSAGYDGRIYAVNPREREIWVSLATGLFLRSRRLSNC